MEDYAALLNRFSKQLARSNFTSSRQSKNPSGQRLQKLPATRVQKPHSGRNSPAAPFNHRASLNSYDHVMPFDIVQQQLPVTRDDPASPNLQQLQPGRPHSWHLSAFSTADYSQSAVSSSYPDSSFAWPLTQSWNASNAQDLSPHDWPASSAFTEMSQGISPDNVYAFDDGFGHSPDIFDNLPDSAGQSIIDMQPNAPLSHASLAGDAFGPLPERHVAFDGFYGATSQPVAELGVSRQSFDGIDIFNEPNTTQSTQQNPVHLVAIRGESTASTDEELIGLGLYDKAEDTARQNQQLSRQRPTLLFGDVAQPTGKGLKLEETWQPPSEAVHALGGYEHGIVAVTEHGYDEDDAGDSSNDGYDDGDAKHRISVYEQQIATPIDVAAFSSFPLSQAEEQFLFGDVTGFADGLMDGHHKAFSGQGEYEFGWPGQNAPVQFV